MWYVFVFLWVALTYRTSISKFEIDGHDALQRLQYNQFPAFATVYYEIEIQLQVSAFQQNLTSENDKAVVEQWHKDRSSCPKMSIPNNYNPKEDTSHYKKLLWNIFVDNIGKLIHT